MTKNERITLLEDNQVVYRKRIEFLGSNIQLLQQDLLASTEYSNDRVNNLDRNINARFDKISKEKEKEKTEVIGIPFQLDKFGHVVFKDKRINPDAFFNYLIDENIDQSNIKGILIEMKEPK